MNWIDKIGQKYGLLTILGEAPSLYRKGGSKIIMVRCVCDCGNDATKMFTLIICGRIKCCGCTIKHPLHRVWAGMLSRCYNQNGSDYHKYGQRGISVCEEWRKDYLSFYYWGIGNGYCNGLTLDRKNNNGNYEPSNCRWATAQVQANNRRSNVYVTLFGLQKVTLADACRIKGVSKKYKVIHQRMVRDLLPFDEAIIFSK
jgi:hypothetical protein